MGAFVRRRDGVRNKWDFGLWEHTRNFFHQPNCVHGSVGFLYSCSFGEIDLGLPSRRPGAVCFSSLFIYRGPLIFPRRTRDATCGDGCDMPLPAHGYV